MDCSIRNRSSPRYCTEMLKIKENIMTNSSAVGLKPSSITLCSAEETLENKILFKLLTGMIIGVFFHDFDSEVNNLKLFKNK